MLFSDRAVRLYVPWMERDQRVMACVMIAFCCP